MKIGLIGTSSIVSYFVSCTKLFDQLELSSVYSRDYNRGFEFAKKEGVNKNYTDFQLFLDSVDIVYVASPNAIHFKQAYEAIKNSKHVLIEKPMTTTYEQTKELFDLAREYNVFIMEAVTSVANPLIENIKSELKDELVTHVSFKMMQQSSRYHFINNNEMVNIFDKTLGGGANYDLGVYLNYFLINLFGNPISSNKLSHTRGEYADLTTTYIHQYPTFDAILCASKVSFSDNYNEIITENKTIKFNSVGELKEVLVYSPNGDLIKKYENHENNRMKFELAHFLEVLNTKKYESALYTEDLALNVIKILEL